MPMHLSEDDRLLFGFPNKYLSNFEMQNGTITLHEEITNDFKRLIRALTKEKLSIKIVSHWRSFQHQSAIWQAKWQGKRQLLDRNSKPINTDNLTDLEKFQALCYWSAIPGLSRHHWGTDFDIFLEQPITEGYQCQLISSEFESGGPCETLNIWLNEHLEEFNFFRPYQTFRGGVSPEPWHISHKRISQELVKKISTPKVKELISQSNLSGKTIINKHLENYINDFILNID